MCKLTSRKLSEVLRIMDEAVAVFEKRIQTQVEVLK